MKGFIKGDQIKRDEKVEAYNTRGVDGKLMKKIVVRKPVLMRQLCLQWRVWADNMYFCIYGTVTIFLVAQTV
jgi:hypothetical protein